MQADVTKTEDVQNYVNRAVEVYGRIDFFFNNAGIVQKFSMLDDIDEDEFDRQMSVNVKGAFLGMKYVLKVMKEQARTYREHRFHGGYPREHSAPLIRQASMRWWA